MESPSDDVYNGLEELISLDDELPDKPVNDDQVDQTQEINNDEELYNGENNGGLLTTPDGLLLGFRSNMEFGLSFDHNHVFATIPQTDQVDQIQVINNVNVQSKSLEPNTNKSRQRAKRRPWNDREDNLLRELVGICKKAGRKNWRDLSRMIGTRTERQCRERWNNHLGDGINKEPWTMEEEQILLEAQKEMKNKWVMIAKKFPGRTASNIKNRWNSMLRRKGHSRTQVPDELKNVRALLA